MAQSIKGPTFGFDSGRDLRVVIPGSRYQALHGAPCKALCGTLGGAWHLAPQRARWWAPGSDWSLLKILSPLSPSTPSNKQNKQIQ